MVILQSILRVIIWKVRQKTFEDVSIECAAGLDL